MARDLSDDVYATLRRQVGVFKHQQGNSLPQRKAIAPGIEGDGAFLCAIMVCPTTASQRDQSHRTIRSTILQRLPPAAPLPDRCG